MKNENILCVCGKVVGKYIFIGKDKRNLPTYKATYNGNEARDKNDGVVDDFKDHNKILCKDCYKERY